MPAEVHLQVCHSLDAGLLEELGIFAPALWQAPCWRGAQQTLQVLVAGNAADTIGLRRAPPTLSFYAMLSSRDQLCSVYGSEPAM